MQCIEGFYKAASFGNLLVFLLKGRYRSLIERALQARLVYGSPNMNRAEMLLLLLPLLNSSSVKSFLRPFSKDKSSNSAGNESLCPICQVLLLLSSKSNVLKGVMRYETSRSRIKNHKFRRVNAKNMRHNAFHIFNIILIIFKTLNIFIYKK